MSETNKRTVVAFQLNEQVRGSGETEAVKFRAVVNDSHDYPGKRIAELERFTKDLTGTHQWHHAGHVNPYLLGALLDAFAHGSVKTIRDGETTIVDLGLIDG